MYDSAVYAGGEDIGRAARSPPWKLCRSLSCPTTGSHSSWSGWPELRSALLSLVSSAISPNPSIFHLLEASLRPLILPVAALAFVVGCDARTVTVEIAPDRATYSRDPRTGLCFAAFGRAHPANVVGRAESFSITAVPCSAEVLALVPRAQGGRG